MNSLLKKLFVFLLYIVSTVSMVAQTTVTGAIIDVNTLNPLEGVHILVVGTVTGATTDANGKYTLSTDQEPPFTIRYSYRLSYPRSCY